MLRHTIEIGYLVDMKKVDANYTCDTLSKLDGRTKAARLAKSLRSELVEHVGPHPSAVQRLLIDQAIALQLRLAMADAGDFAAGDYLATSTALANTLSRIGIREISDATYSSSPLVAA